MQNGILCHLVNSLVVSATCGIRLLGGPPIDISLDARLVQFGFKLGKGRMHVNNTLADCHTSPDMCCEGREIKALVRNTAYNPG